MSVRIVSSNTADSATLSSPDFVAGLPVTNLQLEGRGKVARTANATGVKTVNGDFASASTVACLVLYNHNLSSLAKLRLRTYDGAAQTGSSSHTNLLPYSEQFGSWGSSLATVVTDYTGAPDGTTSADKLTIGAGGYVFQGVTVSVSVGQSVTFSFYSRTPTVEGTGAGFGGSTPAGSQANKTEALADGWYRHSLVRTFTVDAPGANIQCIFRGSIADVVVWGAQLELGAAATSYIKTTTSQVTEALPTMDTGWVSALPGLGWGEFQWGAVPWGATVFTGWGSAFSDFWFSPVGALSFKLELYDPANPAGYLQIKRLLIGSYFEPGVNVSYGMNLKWNDNSEQTRTQGGSLRTDNRVMYRSLTADLGHLTPAERAIFMDIVRTIGLRKETFISVWPDAGGALERDHALLGKFTDLPDFIPGMPSSYQSNIQFEEV